MRRIGILTAGGDTPALNATVYGAVERASALEIEVFGIMGGFGGMLDEDVPHIHLNPLFITIPELDPCLGGTLLGASRTYIDPDQRQILKDVTGRLERLGIEGLVCIGGDGTINGMQPLAEFFPCVLAPKTIDNDLGLNHLDEPNEWIREESPNPAEPSYRKLPGREEIELDDIINYATPGYATAVFVVAQAIRRIRTTAESHRRIAIVEVMGRRSGYIALGSAYGQPDLIFPPEVPLNLPEAEQPRRSSTFSFDSSAMRSARIVGTNPQARQSLPERSATHSAADGRSSSTASTPRSWAVKPSTCSSAARTTAWPRCSGPRKTGSISTRCPPTSSATAGGPSIHGWCIGRCTTLIVFSRRSSAWSTFCRSSPTPSAPTTWSTCGPTYSTPATWRLATKA